MVETLHDRLKKRLAELNITPTHASTAAGLNRTYLRKLFERPDSVPSARALARLADVLDVSSDWLLDGIDPPEGSDLPADVANARNKDFRRADVVLPVSDDMPKDIEVLGTAAGSKVHLEFEGIEIEGRVENVRRPPALVGVTNAYAIYVTGDSMYPMHCQGDLRFVHPGRPPQPGDTVVVVTRSWNDDPGQAYIKIYRRRRGGMVVLDQLNPQATLEIPEEYVISIHKVPTMNELFGV